MTDPLIETIQKKALAMRRRAIGMTLNAGPKGVHLGPGFSIMEIMACLYFSVLRHDPLDPRWPDRDRFILSKGHGVLGLYTALAEAGYISDDVLARFDSEGSPLAGHPSKNLDLGIEASTGSLGHGLSIGVGIALSARLQKKSYDTYVLVGDGECNEGTIWEGVMAASHFKLGNMVAIVDRNKMQADGDSINIMDMGDMAEKWRSFGWTVREIDGHDIDAILSAFDKAGGVKGIPTVIIANTTKGKGISFAENQAAFHNCALTKEQYGAALAELDERISALAGEG